eukprot:CAMPEP_0184535612 /NCGR_PEP_ID=MMETSP0198_2-20121128/15988_1 /TAXON_ID=1112570 /ORGANISM="Thraustochytrium sp., Strain LLF1b" /LENGTH=237 /DNA_ID=CAMNT_0026928677 /DNA_START=155 /DNA_END=864 /DNA_ORIENTATION=+
MSERVKGSFFDEFKPGYKRNKKNSQQNTLRCFPKCSEAGHSTSGFCGRPLYCQVSGVTTSLQAMKDQERSRKDPYKPFIRGEVTLVANTQDTYDIFFNRQLLCWNYNWTSTKHTCDALHMFVVRVYTQGLGSEQIEYAASLRSPVFQLYSRRRGKNSPVEQFIKTTDQEHNAAAQKQPGDGDPTTEPNPTPSYENEDTSGHLNVPQDIQDTYEPKTRGQPEHFHHAEARAHDDVKRP